MINLILVITTPSKTTTIHSGFCNRTLVIWVMNLQFETGTWQRKLVSAPLHQLGGMMNIWSHVHFHQLTVDADCQLKFYLGAVGWNTSMWPSHVAWPPYTTVAGSMVNIPKEEKSIWMWYCLSFEVKPSLLPYSVNWDLCKCLHRSRGRE